MLSIHAFHVFRFETCFWRLNFIVGLPPPGFQSQGIQAFFCEDKGHILLILLITIFHVWALRFNKSPFFNKSRVFWNEWDCFSWVLPPRKRHSSRKKVTSHCTTSLAAGCGFVVTWNGRSRHRWWTNMLSCLKMGTLTAPTFYYTFFEKNL